MGKSVDIKIQKRIALIVGNSEYDDSDHCPPLSFCKDDATSMASALKKCGFETIICKNATKSTLIDSLSAFAQKLSFYDVALVYYSGHGLELGNRNYILPVDIIIPEVRNIDAFKTKFANNAIDIQSNVLSLFNKRQNKINFLILDACRIDIGDHLGKSADLEEERFSSTDQHAGTAIVFATGFRHRSFENAHGKHGAFTGELLKLLMEPGLSYRDLFASAAQNTVELQEKYPNEFPGLQQPQISDMIYGKFQFMPHGKSESVLISKDVAPTLARQSYNLHNNEMEFIDPVVICKKSWMKSNLKVTRYQDGNPIPHANNQDEWEQYNEMKMGCWCYPEFNEKNGEKYGLLYNKFSITSNRILIPNGWHLPSHLELSTINTSLNSGAAGKELKSRVGWMDRNNGDNGNGSNGSGWNGLPGGGHMGKSFYKTGYAGTWWLTESYALELYNTDDLMHVISRSSNDQLGCFIRLIKN